MKITQIRNATLRLDFGGVRFLIDPMLNEKGTSPGFPGSANNEFRNPLVPLPAPIAEIVDVDAVIVTHLHADHWDDAAKANLKKWLPIFAQNEEDAAEIRGAGFTDVRVLTEASEFNGIKLAKTGGQHGTDATLGAIPRLGEVCGVVFSHPSEKSIYVAGDTIWNRHVEEAIAADRPQIIVLNAGNGDVHRPRSDPHGRGGRPGGPSCCPGSDLDRQPHGSSEPLHPEPRRPAGLRRKGRLLVACSYPQTAKPTRSRLLI